MKKSIVKMYVENGLEAAIRSHEKKIEKLKKSKNRYKEQLVKFFENALNERKRELEELRNNFSIEDDK